MPRHTLTLPPSSWPEDLRYRFERHPLSAAQRKRLGRALGRWLRISNDLGAEARDVSRETWLERTQGLSRRVRNEVRQALAIVFPDISASLYAEENRQTERTDILTEPFLLDLEAFLAVIDEAIENGTTLVWRGHEHDPDCGYTVPVRSDDANALLFMQGEIVDLVTAIEGALDGAKAYVIANSFYD